MVIGSYPRSPAQLLAPFSADGLFAGLKPIHCSATPVSDVAWAQYERDHDAPGLARRRAGFFPTPH